MHRHRSRPLLAAVAAFAVVTPALAQGSLAELQRAFDRQRDGLYANGALPTQAQEQALQERQLAALKGWLAQAKGAERANGMLLLAELWLRRGDRAAAKQSLLDLDHSEAAPTTLLVAADLLTRLGDRAARDGLVQAALAKATALDDRLAAAKLLMTRLHDVPAGEAIFRDTLAAAKDDEGRAYVRWHQADALRSREDVGDNAFFDALEALAKDLPRTYWGSVARDRNQASQWRLGSDGLGFAATTTERTRVEWGALRGRGVLLAFWSAADDRAKDLVAAVQAARKQHGDDLFVLGVSLDEDPARFGKACQELGATFLQVCDGKGEQGDLALRFGIEVAPTILVFDRKGRVAGLNLHVDSKDAREELREALQRALQRD